MNNESESVNLRAYRAHWLLPLSAPPIENGVIVIDDQQIRAIGAYEDLADSIPEPLTDLGEAVIFPAFVNVHTHLEQDTLQEPVRRFFDYLSQSAIRLQNQSDEQRAETVRSNIQESRRFGTIALGDFSKDGLSVQILQEEFLFARVFHEVRGFKQYESAEIFKSVRDQLGRVAPMKRITSHLGMSSLWELSADLLREISIFERHVAIHMAMTEAETEFLINGAGPVRQYLLAGGDYDYTWKPPRMTSVQYFFNNHFAARHNILIHMNQLTGNDIDLIKETSAKVNVCICPRTASNLEWHPTPVKQILERGVNICMGTESKALAGDLDMRKEIVECINQTGVNIDTALKFATLNGAYAIGFHKEVGSLDTGKTARCLVLPIENINQNDPYAALLDLSREVRWLDEINPV